METILSTLGEGVVLYDRDLRFQFWSPFMETLTGLTAADVVGKKPSDVCPALGGRETGRLLNRALRGESVESGDTAFEVPSTGRHGWVVARFDPYRDAGDEIVGVAAMLRDVSEQKRAEDDMRRALADKNELLKEVHHRVKNNMAVISSLIGLQGEDVIHEETADSLNKIRGRIRAMALVHDQMYRSEDYRKVDLGEYARSLGDSLMQHHPGRAGRVGLQTRIADVAVTIDVAIPCGLILNELITNALEHAFPNGRHGEIVVALDRCQDGRFELAVTDNGHGLDRDSDIGGAKRMGLQLVELLAKQLGGEFEANWDRGADVRVRFATEEP